MKVIINSLITVLILISGVSSAGVIYEGKMIYESKVNEIAIDKGTGDKVFVKVGGAEESTSTCHTVTNWSIVLPLVSDTDIKMFSMLPNAKASETKVSEKTTPPYEEC